MLVDEKFNCIPVYSNKIDEVEFEIYLLKPFHNEKFLVVRKENNEVSKFIFRNNTNLNNLIKAIENKEQFKLNSNIVDKNLYFERNIVNFIRAGITFKKFVQAAI